VVTAGKVEAKERFRWNVNIRVPVWQQGL